ncbi:unnamed protein product [Adineta steineri]|uniref:Uncharacterized protein n=1 Tax=Adineta steineri TaxID=433720 RepID=A0A818KK85_9BILA|nr:unnamed protein product [Adineta steineri]
MFYEQLFIIFDYSNFTLKKFILYCNTNEPETLRHLVDGLQSCKDLDTVKLVSMSLGDEGIQYVADGLRNNTKLVEINFSNTYLESESIRILAEVLGKNTALTILDLSENNIEGDGIQHLTLTTLKISNNDIGEEGIRHIADALKTNNTITTLNIGLNKIKDEGAGHLGTALRDNKTLDNLDLGSSEIEAEGARLLGDGLRNNKSLTSLKLSGNSIKDDGVQHLVNALENNIILKDIDLAWTEFGEDGKKAIDAYMEKTGCSSNHFYGGTITWKSLNNTDFNSTISVMFTQSYEWRQTQTHCDQSYISNQTIKIPMNGDKLECVTNSSACGNYIPLSVNGYCTDFSTLTDSSSSQISDIEEITMDSKFCVAYQGATWPGIILLGWYVDSAKWSLGCCVDLTLRSDGFINTPPVATVISPIRVPTNTLTNIFIPVTDADNDTLLCRWAMNVSLFDECGDICGEVPGSTLIAENCTLIFNSTGKQAGDFYAVALMVEDFNNETNGTALSSVPIQFLIQIIALPTCYSKPIITSNASTNTIIPVGISYVFTLTIRSDCPDVTIIDYFRAPPLNMHKSNITFNGINNVSSVTETWTPSSDQIGSQTYCSIATDSVSIQSDIYCLTLIVGPSSIQNNTTPSTSNSNTTESYTEDTDDYTTDISTSSTQTTTTTTTTTTETSTTTTSATTTTSTTTTSTTTTTTTATTTTSATTTTTTSTTSTTATTTTTTTATTTTSTTTTSTTSTTTTSTTSTTTTSTSTTTSATTATTTTTTAQEYVTVIVSDLTKDNSGILGLGLGLGLPLVLAFAALTYYALYRRQSMLSGVELFESAETTINQPESIEKLSENNNNSLSDATDNRQELKSTTNENLTNNQSRLTDPEPQLLNGNSFTAVSISDFELHGLQRTTAASLFSSPISDLPNDNVQHTQQFSLDMNNFQPTGSILVRAYTQQGKNNSIDFS